MIFTWTQKNQKKNTNYFGYNFVPADRGDWCLLDITVTGLKKLREWKDGLCYFDCNLAFQNKEDIEKRFSF